MPRNMSTEYMAKCELCSMPMSVLSCKYTHEKINGKWYQRITGYRNAAPSGERCRDCGILCVEGNAHHLNCDDEYCPVCGDQAFGCDCSHEGFATAKDADNNP